MRAEDVMTSDVATISAASSVHQAIRIMVEKNISGLPVLDDERQLVGLLTEGDLMRRMEFGDPLLAAGSSAEDLERYIKRHSWRVGDLMSDSLITVGADTPLGKVAELMFHNRIKRVPVVDGGKLLGVVSRVDLLRAIADPPAESTAKGDEALARAVSARLQTDLGIDSKQIRATVTSGQILLEGTVASDLQRRAVHVLIDNVHGIEGCLDKLTVKPASN
jgi:CBS domain-containing protein